MKSFKKIFKLNKIIWFLTFSDISTWAIYTALMTISGIYLSNKLGENVLVYIGIGAGIYSAMRAIAQIPFGLIEDKIHTQKDELVILLIADTLMGVPFLFYPHISSPIYYYVLQFMLGLGAGMNVVSWRKLFAKNIDSDKEGIEYGVYETVMSIMTASFALIVGYVANINQRYFDLLIVGIGILMMSGSIWAAMIYYYKYIKNTITK